MNITETLLTRVDTITAQFVFGGYQAFVQSYGTTICLALIIYVVWHGWQMLQGISAITIENIGPQFLRLSFIYAFATDWAVFSAYVYDFITNTPGHLAAVLTSSVGSSFFGTASLNNALGIVFDKTWSVVGDLFNQAGLNNLMLYLYAALVLLGGTSLVGYTLFLLILAKLGLAIVLVLAPIFITCLLFNQTRGFFEGWVRQLVNFALIPVLVAGVLVVVLTLLETTVNTLETSQLDPTAISTFLLVTFVSIVLLMQVMGIAAGIAGGFSLSTLSAPGAAKQKMGSWVRKLANRF